MKKAILAFVAICCLTFGIHANPFTITVPKIKVDLKPADYRLERFVLPSNYKITLRLDKDFHTPADKPKFNIDLCVITFGLDASAEVLDKKKIRIHYDVDFLEDKVQLTDKDGATVVIQSFTAPDPITQIAVITLTEDLDPAKAEYKLQFTGLTGTLRSDMAGFYLSTYKDGGTEKFIATTQFQATHARTAFPCFDEPFFKATFDISIIAPKEYTTVIGNTKEKIKTPEELEEDPELLTTTFDTTPKMSTYLVAFIVSTFEKTDDSEHAIFVPEGMVSSAAYAKSKTSGIIDDLGTKLGIKYDKLGNSQLYQVAIPDFFAGAMENWGLITYRETALLWDETESSARNKQRVCSVIAHEISHMWFGDYVTMDWWSDTFLNEGFARYFEYHTTAVVEPDFDMKNQFVVEQQQVIFNADAVSKAPPLSSDPQVIYTPRQVQSKFGTISYNKGGSVFRMIERAMGEEKFFKALTEYISKHGGKNTILADLLQEFQKEGLRPDLTNWFTEGGFPVVTVTRQGNDVLLSQQRFLLDGKTSDTKWTIPITYKTDSQVVGPPIWMDQTEKTTKIVDAFKNTEIVILNVEGSGYYRVNYERSILERINEQLRTATKGKVQPLDRAILIDDVMNMARVGLQSYDMALDLTKYLASEEDYYPWVSAFNSFAFLNKRIGNDEVANWFKEYITRMSKKLINSVSFVVPDGHINILKMVLALQWACDLNVESCVTKSKQMFADYIGTEENTPNPINPNLRSVVYCNGIRYGINPEWDFLFGKYLTSASASEKVAIISALGCSTDKEQLKIFLDKSLMNTEIRKQDAYSVFTSVVQGNAGNLDTAFNFLNDNFEQIHESYASMNALSNIFNMLADRFTTSTQVKKFEDFLTTNEVALGEAFDVGKRALATANANMAWTNKFQDTIRSWLSRERGSSSTTVTASVLVVVTAVCMTFLY